MSVLKVVVIGTDAAYGAAVRDIIAAQLPDAVSEMHDPVHVRTRPAVDALVVDARADAAKGAEFAKKTRAMGFAGAIVIVCEADDAVQRVLATAGAAAMPAESLANGLMATMEEQLVRAASEHAAQVMHARRLVAAGEIALGFQHSLNNPLAGILAEAQLMQLDPLPAEQHAALDRIVGLCRRIIDLGKSLDGMGQRK